MSKSGEVRRRRLSRAEAKARTRERLLDSAARVFAEKGFGGATLEEIAESAGYSTGAMYANFGNKEQLFLEVVAAHRSRAAVRRIEQVTEIFDEALASGADPFDALTGMFVKAADRDRELAPLQAEFWLYAVRNPELMESLAERMREPRDLLTALISQSAPDAARADQLATIIMALFQGLVRQRRTDPDSVPEELFGQALNWLFTGAEADEESP